MRELGGCGDFLGSGFARGLGTGDLLGRGFGRGLGVVVEVGVEEGVDRKEEGRSGPERVVVPVLGSCLYSYKRNSSALVAAGRIVAGGSGGEDLGSCLSFRYYPDLQEEDASGPGILTRHGFRLAPRKHRCRDGRARQRD